jgi:hypoxanthine phosphoribosyltransferase
VECTINLLKQARRFATGYEKTLRNYTAVVAMGCALLMLPHRHSREQVARGLGHGHGHGRTRPNFCSGARAAVAVDSWLMTERPRTLFSAEQIAQRVRELGAEIARDYAGRSLVLVCVLKGSIVFASDLMRAIDLPLRVDFLGVRSYGAGTETSGVVQITQDLSRPIEHEHVLLVEDIVDTGLTVAHLIDLLKTRAPASVRVCALLHKPARSRISVAVDYLGFTIDDRFVVGYGLDHAERHRNLPYIGVIERS